MVTTFVNYSELHSVPIEPTIPAECVASFGGVASFVLLAALPIAILMTWATVMLFRRSVLRVMSSLSAPRQAPNESSNNVSVSATPNRPLRIDYVSADASAAISSSLIERAHTHARQAGRAYAIAGIAHALIATVLTFLFGDIEFLPVRIFAVAYLYAWPVVPTLMLTSINNPRLKWLWLIGYFAIMFGFDFALSAFNLRTDPGGGSLFSIWLVWMGPPSLLLLILSNRAWRAVGLLAYFVAVALVAAWLLSTQGIACLALALNDVGIWIQYRWIVLGLLLFLFVGGAWWVLQRIATRYRRKLISDQSLILGSWWLVITLVDIIIQFDATHGASVSLILSWIAYRWISAALQPSPNAEESPPSLLLLRVFGYRRRSRRLLDQLSQRWRHIGPISLIGAPDLAVANLEPDELMQFWGFRLRQLFVATPQDLQNKLAHFDNQPDPDGRYRVNEFYCYDNTWRDTVYALATQSSVVIMDLRGFGMNNQGCRFELRMLLDSVPLPKILLLIDRSTEKYRLEKLLQNLWQALPNDSVNFRTSYPSIRIFEAAGSLHSVNALLNNIASGNKVIPTLR